MRGAIAGLLVAVVCLFAPASAQTEPVRLTLGVFPYASPKALAHHHGPLRTWLSEHMGVPVSLVTAPDFRTFAWRTCEGVYDVVVTAPHLARLAQRDCGFSVLAMAANRSQAVFVVRADSGMSHVQDLRGHVLHVPPEMALIHHMGLRILRDAGIDPDRDLTVVPSVSHVNALMTVARSGGGAVAGLSIWSGARFPGRDALVEIGRSQDIPGFVVLGHPRLGSERLTHLVDGLLGLHELPESQVYFVDTGMVRFRHPEPELLDAMDEFADEVARFLTKVR